MNHPLPTLFISHGSPDLVLSRRPARARLVELGSSLPTPRAIVVVSAHWIARPVGITAAAKPGVLHDFGGFPKPLYALDYPCPGDPELARHIHTLLSEAGIPAREEADRPLDHGVWSPLMLLYPEAEIPVVQLSLPRSDLAGAIALGEALAPLRGEGVLVIGSGGAVHNLRALAFDGETSPWAQNFDDWLCGAVEEGGFSQAAESRHWPDSFAMAHPSAEHYVPLLVAWAAAGRDTLGERVLSGFDLGNLSMAAYRFAQ